VLCYEDIAVVLDRSLMVINSDEVQVVVAKMSKGGEREVGGFTVKFESGL